jgi:hypothetical protein
MIFSLIAMRVRRARHCAGRHDQQMARCSSTDPAACECEIVGRWPGIYGCTFSPLQASRGRE